LQHFDKAIVGADKWLMQLGTLSGNPVVSVAGIKTMEILRRPGQYEKLRQIGIRLQTMQSDHLNKAGIAH
jgi:glutamate-1-semialdehyde 2,1-aminomutase